MNEELKYSDNGLLNKDIFFNNDINFYIEDEEKEYRYETIFKELFPNIKIETILGLGGKNNLKNKYVELKNKNMLKNNFFIADLDFDFLLNKDIIENKHFIYLEKYEIENYIIDKNAIIRFLKNELCCRETEVNKLINYDIWIQETCDKLYDLFIYYLIVQKNDIELKNTNENANSYFDDNGIVKIQKINEYHEKLKEMLKLQGKNIEEEIANAKKVVIEQYGKEFSKLIRGKFIISGIRKYLSYVISQKQNKKRKVNEKNLIDYLFDWFDKNSLNFIKDQVKECLNK